jgi:hypothetical protein
MTATTVITAKATWKQGNNLRVSFANLDKLQRYEPQTYALFTQPVQDGERVSTPQYDYVVKIQRWGPSITRFLKESNVSTPQEEQQLKPQQLSTEGSLGQLQSTLSNKTRLMLELKKLQIRMNTIVQELEIEINER